MFRSCATYATTAAKLALLKNRVKQDGIIAGHHYSMENWVAGLRYGMIEAVRELCATEDWKIILRNASGKKLRDPQN